VLPAPRVVVLGDDSALEIFDPEKRVDEALPVAI
jgi:hypothetical protein